MTPERIIETLVADLTAMDATLSGDDSPLTNVWEEIKEQVQHGPSIYWDAYSQVMGSLINAAVEDVIENGGTGFPSHFDDDDIHETLVALLIERAQQEPVECGSFDFEYFCYRILDFTGYAKFIKRTGVTACQARVFSMAAPYGEFGSVPTSRIECVLSEDEFEFARERGWPREWP
jgi:hypothetical protein